MDQVVHFEIPVDDVERARGFYGTVFEWGMPMDDADYTFVLTTPVDEKGPMENRTPIEPGAINGGLMHRSSDTPAPVVTIQVDSIDESSRRSRPRAGAS
jgi:uncharacterized protein